VKHVVNGAKVGPRLKCSCVHKN